MNDLDLIFVVPFRAGSKGLKDKNISNLNGSPLYLHTLNQALLFSGAEIFATTDYPINQLIDFPKDVNHIVRESHLCTDGTTMTDVITDFLLKNVKRKATIVLLQVTSPLRSVSDIESAITLFKDSKFDLVMTVSKTDSSVLKYGLITDDCLFTPIHSPKSCFQNRQDLPSVFRPNGMIYIFDSKFFLENQGFATDNIGVFITPSERSIDIDSVADLAKATRYLK
ncbi:acylneuraminate cytidylyltransferase family protein [Gammaproteobacteria bacterium]|nr:acylneuraminate cytidylyltransferase family protein [Gammaproteobacteria bacterium]